MVVHVLLLGLLAAASVTDVCRHRIPNWLTYGGILAAWALNAVGAALVAWVNANPESLEKYLGCVGIAEGFFGFLLCGSVLLLCFVFFKVGGGDVKLMAMLGAFLGPDKGIEAMLWTFVLGACMGLIVLIWRVGPWSLVARVLRHRAWTVRLRSWAPLSEEERAQLETRLFLAPSALAAVVIVRFSLAGLV